MRENDRAERDLWHIMFLQMSRSVWMLRVGRTASHCPSACRRKVAFVSIFSDRSVCVGTRLCVDLLVQEHPLLVASKRPFRKCFFECMCACLYTHLSFSWSDQHVQGRVFYSNQFHYWIDLLTFLYWRWSSTNTSTRGKEKTPACCIKDKEIARCIISIALWSTPFSSLYQLVHDKEQLSQDFVHDVRWETIQQWEREREKDEHTKKRKGQKTNEPDSSLLFCSEEQSGWLSHCNYHHHHLRHCHHIVHASFPQTKTRGSKSSSLPWTSVICPLAFLFHQFT